MKKLTWLCLPENFAAGGQKETKKINRPRKTTSTARADFKCHSVLWQAENYGKYRQGRAAGGGKGWGRCKQHIKHMFFGLLQLLRGSLYWKDKKKEWSSPEQASNETVAKNFWRYLLTNPDTHISENITIRNMFMSCKQVARYFQINRNLWTLISSGAFWRVFIWNHVFFRNGHLITNKCLAVYHVKLTLKRKIKIKYSKN